MQLNVAIGHLSCLQWTRENSCLWNERTCHTAAALLSILQYKLDAGTCSNAAYGDRPSCLQLATENPKVPKFISDSENINFKIHHDLYTGIIVFNLICWGERTYYNRYKQRIFKSSCWTIDRSRPTARERWRNQKTETNTNSSTLI